MRLPTTYHLLPTSPSRAPRAGFSLLELLIFSAIFTMVILAFITILVAVVRVQARQYAAAEVNQQSQFLLQQIQYHVERSSLVELPQDVATSTLKLRMSATSSDPMYIFLSGGVVYLQRTDGGAQNPLTSNKVIVSDLTFTKRSNAPSHDSVSVSFTVQYDTENVQQKFVRTLNTAIARVSAATFDSNILPSSTAIYSLGISGQTWTSVNDIIYFSGSNVGIGVSSPNAALHVVGNEIYVDDVTGSNLILRSPDGTCWWIQPTNAGAYSSASSTCP